MKNQIILNPTEKKRNVYSAEYFSQGASQQLKESFKNNMASKYNSFIDKMKKQKEDFDKKRKEKEDEAKRLKAKTKRNKFELKIGIRTKIFAFLALSVSAVIFFKKFEDKIYNFAGLPNRMLKKLSKLGYKFSAQVVIDKHFKIDTNTPILGENGDILKDEKGEEITLEKSIDTFNNKLHSSFIHNYSEPIINSVDFILHRNTDTNPLYKKWSPYLREGQRQDGIIFNTFKTIATYAIIHLLNRRGYGIVLDILNIKTPEVDDFDMSLYRSFKKDNRYYSHIGRNIGSPSRLGDELMSQLNAKRQLLKSSFDAYTVSISDPNIDAISKMFGKTGDTKVISKSFGNLNEIISILKSDDKKLLDLARGKYSSPTNTLQLVNAKYEFEISTDRYIPKPESYYSELTKRKYNDLSKISIEAERGEKFGLDGVFGDFYKLNKSHPDVFSTLVNQGVEYINEMYPKIWQDKRILQVVNEGIKYITSNYTSQFDEEHADYWSRTYGVNTEKHGSKEYSKFVGGENTWKLGGALVLLQLVKIISEWEIYQSFLAARTIDMMYADFINNPKLDKIEFVANKIQEDRNKKVEKWMIEYARGRKSLNDFLHDYQDAVAELFINFPKFEKKKIKIKGETREIRVLKKRENTVAFPLFKKMFNNLSAKIDINLNTSMKKINYGGFKSKITKIGGRIRNIRNGVDHIGGYKRNLLHLDNESLRENFNTQRLKKAEDKFNDWEHADFKGNVVKGISGIQFNAVSSNVTQYKIDNEKIQKKLNETPADFREHIKNITSGAWVMKHHGVKVFSREWIDGTESERLSIYNDWKNSGGDGLVFIPEYTVYNSKKEYTDTIQRGFKELDKIEGSWFSIKFEKEVQYRDKARKLYVFESERPYPIRFSIRTYKAESVEFDEKTNEAKLYLDTIDQYQYYNYKEKKWYIFGYEMVERKPSEKSHAAIYKENYDETKLKEIYNLPTEAIVKQIRVINDYLSEEMNRIIEERCIILDKILNSKNFKEREVTLSDGKVYKKKVLNINMLYDNTI